MCTINKKYGNLLKAPRSCIVAFLHKFCSFCIWLFVLFSPNFSFAEYDIVSDIKAEGLSSLLVVLCDILKAALVETRLFFSFC